MLNHDRFAFVRFDGGSIHITPEGFVDKCLVIGILFRKLHRHIVHRKIIRLHRNQIVHLIAAINIQQLTNRTQTMRWV
ncbi:MAG: hypothetical protein EBV51_07190 [Acidimicrobiia bacterium]|nr:hypothetical protein [Acidimicrobiia bacterium]